MYFFMSITIFLFYAGAVFKALAFQIYDLRMENKLHKGMESYQWQD
jgi:hypothetical protein